MPPGHPRVTSANLIPLAELACGRTCHPGRAVQKSCRHVSWLDTWEQTFPVWRAGQQAAYPWPGPHHSQSPGTSADGSVTSVWGSCPLFVPRLGRRCWCSKQIKTCLQGPSAPRGARPRAGLPPRGWGHWGHLFVSRLSSRPLLRIPAEKCHLRERMSSHPQGLLPHSARPVL